MKNYELSCLATADISIDEAQVLSSEIASQIQKQGGLILKSENPSPKTLGYKIKKQASALWMNIEFSLEQDKLNIVGEDLKKEPRILRYMIVVKKPVKEKPLRVRKEEPTEEEKTKKKVELKDIDQKLDEILGQ